MIPRRLQIRSLLTELEKNRAAFSLALMFALAVLLLVVEWNRHKEYQLLTQERTWWEQELVSTRNQVESLTGKLEALNTQRDQLHKDFEQFQRESNEKLSVNNKTLMRYITIRERR